MNTNALNTHAVAKAGLWGGGATILAASSYFFKVISDPNELIGLYEAARTHTDPHGALARVAGAGIAIVGAWIVTLLAAYFGKPEGLK